MKKYLAFYSIAALFLIFLQACSPDDDFNGPDSIDDYNADELDYPKKELRGAWMATIFELDWPQGQYDENSQKQLYKSYLDKFESLNLNAVFFQIRPEGDAFYDSDYEPWSKSITGTRGQDPGYDVLEFLIEETHKRGMEFHAWMNPYRIADEESGSAIDEELIKDLGDVKIYNPALPEVRTQLSDIVSDLINDYAVDGLHFDDYFYPPDAEYDDNAEYEEYGDEYSSIEDFRRGNVNKLIEHIYEVVKNEQPEVVFSIGPAPNQESNYKNLYADVKKWNQEGWLDIVIPQLYQEIGNQFNDFATNLEYWNANRYEAELMIGLGIYKFGDPDMPSAFQSTDELEKQFSLMDDFKSVVGSLSYSARFLMENKIGVVDKLESIYENPAVIPFTGRSVAPDPEKPENVHNNGEVLKWTHNANKSVVYYFPNLDSEGEVHTITTENEATIKESGFYVVTALNAKHKESSPSEIFDY